MFTNKLSMEALARMCRTGTTDLFVFDLDLLGMLVSWQQPISITTGQGLWFFQHFFVLVSSACGSPLLRR